MDTLLLKGSGQWSVERAFAYCREQARTHYENFTVGSWLLPRRVRRHVYAIYAYCRGVDDLGDEAQGDRLALLDRWEAELRSCFGGRPSHPVFIALQQSIRQFDIPIEPFQRLVEANRLDQRRHRHPTYQDLLYYCEHSANPVGHLFLYLFGYRDHEHQRLADCTCTALQLTNFWQDLRRDLERGRIYLPLEDMARFGYSEGELQRHIYNDAFVRLMAFEIERARGLFQQGLALVDRVEGMVKVDIKLFSLGGLAILDRIERQRFNVFARRPTLSRARKAWLLARTLASMALP